MGVEHWDKQRALALPRRLYMGSIIVEHLAIAIQPPDRYTTGCTLIGRKSVTTTRHAGKACLRAWPRQNSLHEAYLPVVPVGAPTNSHEFTKSVLNF